MRISSFAALSLTSLVVGLIPASTPRGTHAYDDRGKHYLIRASFRWDKEWMDARHHRKSAWQEGEAAWRSSGKAISVCVTYYDAPYYACQGDSVDWYWGYVGKRSGYVTAVDPRCPDCRHEVWGLFRRFSHTSASQAMAPSTPRIGLHDRWTVLAPDGETRLTSLGQQGDNGLIRRVYELRQNRRDCLLVKLEMSLGRVLGCSPASKATYQGVALELKGRGSTTIVGAVPAGTLSTTIVGVGGARIPIDPAEGGGFVKTIQTTAVRLVLARRHRTVAVPLA